MSEDKFDVLKEAAMAQARMLQRQRQAKRAADVAASGTQFQRAGAAIKRIIDEAASRSGFEIAWSTGEARRRDGSDQ
jgi:hypothetical protein